MTDEDWFHEAERVARGALCARAKCGAVIVSSEGTKIGEGYNAPPVDDMTNAKCAAEFDRAKKPKYDLTCCMHAEWRAIMDALEHHPESIRGSVLYYVRLGDDGKRRPSREPFCTVCSRLALDAGVARFGLWHEPGIVLYDTREYNERSYAFHAKGK
jgi:deoxycytidylate deaminase